MDPSDPDVAELRFPNGNRAIRVDARAGEGWGAIVLPSVVALLVAWGGRRAFGKRWVLLRAAAESVRSETFRYRTKTGPYRPTSC